nr:hypothetical protein [Anaerolineae bacterium]
REFQTIRVDVRGEPDPTARIINQIALYPIEDAVVRVIVTATPENEALIRDRDIMQALKPAYYIAAIERDIEYPLRARLGVERPEGLTPLELLERYLQAKGADPARIKVLLEYAQEVFSLQSDPN